MARRDRRLQRVGAQLASEVLDPRERRKAPVDQEAIPAAAILFEQEDRPSLPVGPGSGALGLEFHEGDEAVGLGILRHE